jgi:hypothetical protein
MQDEEDETDHLPLRLGDTVVAPSLKETEISRCVRELWRPQAGQLRMHERAALCLPKGR